MLEVSNRCLSCGVEFLRTATTSEEIKDLQNNLFPQECPSCVAYNSNCYCDE